MLLLLPSHWNVAGSSSHATARRRCRCVAPGKRHATIARRTGEDDGQARAATALRHCLTEGRVPPSRSATLLPALLGKRKVETLRRVATAELLVRPGEEDIAVPCSRSLDCYLSSIGDNIPSINDDSGLARTCLTSACALDITLGFFIISDIAQPFTSSSLTLSDPKLVSASIKFFTPTAVANLGLDFDHRVDPDGPTGQVCEGKMLRVGGLIPEFSANIPKRAKY
nr:hypothetical protein Iba_chr13dCG4220 [Ipomoea batatas]